MAQAGGRRFLPGNEPQKSDGGARGNMPNTVMRGSIPLFGFEIDYGSVVDM